MIKSMQIENFRCFKSLKLSDLRPVNIIVGKNASGKTALLEAIKMGLDGFPVDLPFLNQLRNIPTVMATPVLSAEHFQASFKGFFHEFNLENVIDFKIEDSNNRYATLRIFFDPKQAKTTQLELSSDQPLPSPAISFEPLVFERSDFHRKESTLMATINEEGKPHFQPGKPLGIVSGIISVAHFGNANENASWLSKLSISKQAKELIESLKQHYQFILDVASETPIPGQGMIYVELANLPQRIPLSLVSGGISRLFTMMLAIAEFRGGVVLIDEIENGIFYDQYQSVWETLADLAHTNETQLFISSHSKECLKGVVNSIAKNPDKFCLLRVRKENSHSSIEQFRGDQLEAALEIGGEIRG